MIFRGMTPKILIHTNYPTQASMELTAEASSINKSAKCYWKCLYVVLITHSPERKKTMLQTQLAAGAICKAAFKPQAYFLVMQFLKKVAMSSTLILYSKQMKRVATQPLFCVTQIEATAKTFALYVTQRIQHLFIEIR